ncbi:hypothetical protein BT092_08820 [Corynebacterium diphtheriae]|nr:hypothetical protein BT092_08820 [Corynebacterium diphtheriae]
MHFQSENRESRTKDSGERHVTCTIQHEKQDLCINAEDYSRPMHLTSTELEFIDPLTGRPRLFTGAVIR